MAMTILAVLAVLPAAVLLYVIYKADNVEKEPIKLMAIVFGLGVLSTISASILEWAGMYVLSYFFYTPNVLYNLIFNFLVVGLAEEVGKFFVTKKATWKNKEFNFSFDGIVYAVCASLGFATLENILYVFQGGLYVAIMRAILSVPGHCIFGVFMGVYYGLAKGCELRGNQAGMKLNLRKALWIPVGLHGLYDFCLSTEIDGILIVFIALEIFMVYKAIKLVKKMSALDMPLAPGVTAEQAVAMNKAADMTKSNPQFAQAQMFGGQPMQAQPVNPAAQMFGAQPKAQQVNPAAQMFGAQPKAQQVNPAAQMFGGQPMQAQPVNPAAQMFGTQPQAQPVQPVNAEAQLFGTQPQAQPVQPVNAEAQLFGTQPQAQPAQPVNAEAQLFGTQTAQVQPVNPAAQMFGAQPQAQPVVNAVPQTAAPTENLAAATAPVFTPQDIEPANPTM